MTSQTRIKIAACDTPWSDLYRRKRSAIERALGSSLSRVSHIGSTAIPGLVAKPDLDLQTEVDRLGMSGFYDPTLKSLGNVSVDSGEKDLRITMRKRSGVAANLHAVAISHRKPGEYTRAKTKFIKRVIENRAKVTVVRYSGGNRHC